MKRITKDSFISFLAEQTPVFDALFLKDYKPKTWYLMPLRRDVRLLPNRYRKDWLVYNGYIKGRRASTRKVWRELNVTDLMDRRLKAWLKSLPKRRRIKERKLRMQRTGFVGKCETGKWKEA